MAKDKVIFNDDFDSIIGFKPKDADELAAQYYERVKDTGITTYARYR